MARAQLFTALAALLLLSHSPRLTVSAPVNATAEIQEAERTALLAISSALQPSSTATGFWQRAKWLPSHGGINPPPCATPYWDFINCTNPFGRVSVINLTSLSTNNAQLSGEIPWGDLEPLTNLSSLLITNQAISGPSFPPNTPTLPNLRFLNLGYNQLTSFTEEVSQLPALRVLVLTGNQGMTGSLPVNLSTLDSLEDLSFRYTAISSPLPSQWSSLTSLSVIDFQYGQISGALPDTFSCLTRLRYLNAAVNHLTGNIPSTWHTLKLLKVVSLTQNNMSGPFPAVVTALTSLSTLDLSKNSFNGPVPSSIWTSTINVDFSGNYFNGSVPSNRSKNAKFAYNCFTPIDAPSANNESQRPVSSCTSFYASLYPVPPPPAPTPSSSSTNIGLIVGLSAAATAIIIGLAILGFCLFQRRDRLAKRLRKGTTQSTREFGLSELKSATKNWGMVLGRGGYGTVYKAILKDGSAVAVKRLDQVSDQGDQEFIREVELLSRVHHRHLVNLIGFCGEKGERALVYEYMGLGSLYEHLHGECAKEQPLTWDSRIKIAIHVAFGIDYLHFGADPPLIHRDIKSGNILLSDDGYAKVADFGLCKEAPVGVSVDGTAQLVPPATEVRGSFGYLDPEYVNTSVLSEKSDVYSYGVVLLELITGKKSIHDWQPLAYWAEPYLEDPNKLEQLVDPALEGEYDAHELQILCDIARSCVYDQSAMRPAIRDVAQALVENLGRVVASTTADSVTDRSTLSSEMASTSDPTDTSGMSSTYSAGTPSAFSFRNANSEAIVGFMSVGEVGEKGHYMLATGPEGNKPPVPVGKHFEDTI